jgi:hypothetical protein
MNVTKAVHPFPFVMFAKMSQNDALPNKKEIRCWEVGLLSKR